MMSIQFFRKLSLRTKFVVSISTLLIATIAFLNTYISKKQAESYRREIENSSMIMINMLAMNSEDGLLFENEYILEDVLKTISKFELVKYAAISNVDGKILASTGSWDDSTETITSRINRKGPDSSRCNDYYCTDSVGQDFIILNLSVMTTYGELDRENLGLTGGIDSSLTNDFVTEKIGNIKLVISLRSVNAAIIQSRNAAILLTIIASIISIFLLTFFIRVITEPINKVVSATDKIIEGDLTQYVEVTQEDEIGKLAHTFNQMVTSLKNSREEIEEYNRTLEEKIIERTIELEDAQAQLVQSEKLGAIGQLAAGVAHELNNPLGGILGYAQFTLEKLKKADPQHMTEKEHTNYIKYLTDIEKQSRRCKNIVQNLLRFSRSSKTTEFIKVDVNSVIEDTCTFVEHQLHMNQIILVKKLGENIPHILGNPGQLQQVLTNLIINAMHASKPDTEIEVSTHYSPALGEFDGTVEITCRDQGSGIPKENVNKIFEPFFTTKDVGKGTGLGLSVSYGIIKEHGGEIRVDSEIGKGTCFTLIIPIQKSVDASDKTDSEGNQYISQLEQK